MTPIPHSISVDIQKHAKRQVVYMKQGDAMSRSLKISFYNDGAVWALPNDITVLQLSYCKPDFLGGCYDHIMIGSNNTAAFSIDNDRTSAEMVIHPQVLTVAGNVICELRLLNASAHVLNTFNFVINVEKSPIAMTSSSEGYYNNVFDGATFTPQIDSNGVLSWTNDKGLENPAPVNLYDVLKTGNLSNLETSAKNTLVAAINEIFGNVGALSGLTTTEKSSIVAAINEILGKLGDLSSLGTTVKSNLVAAINELVSTIGSLSSLTTVAQNNLVAAINEAASRGGAIKLSATRATGSTKDFQASDARLNAEPTEGQQVIICCNLTNDAAAPTLAINGGTAYPIKLRDATERNPGTATDTTTISVPKKGLIKGMPYLMTFYQRDGYTDKCWLIDSQVGVLDAAEKAYVDQELLRLLVQLEGYTDRHIAVSKFEYDGEYSLYEYVVEDYENKKLVVVTKDGNDYVLSDHDFTAANSATRYALFTCPDPENKKIKWVRVDNVQNNAWSCGEFDIADVFVATYGTTTPHEIHVAATAGKPVILTRNGRTYTLSDHSTTYAYFTAPSTDGGSIDWASAEVSNNVTTWTNGSRSIIALSVVHYTEGAGNNSTLQNIANAFSSGKLVVCDVGNTDGEHKNYYYLISSDFSQEQTAPFALFAQPDTVNKLIRWVKATGDSSQSLTVTTWTNGSLDIDMAGKISTLFALLSSLDANDRGTVNQNVYIDSNGHAKVHKDAVIFDYDSLTMTDIQSLVTSSLDFMPLAYVRYRPQDLSNTVWLIKLNQLFVGFLDVAAGAVFDDAVKVYDISNHTWAQKRVTILIEVTSLSPYAYTKTVSIKDENINEKASLTVENIALSYSGWTQDNGLYYQTVSVPSLENVGANEDVLLQAGPSAGSSAAWSQYNVQLIAATAGTMTFRSEQAPSQNENLNAIVAIWR